MKNGKTIATGLVSLMMVSCALAQYATYDDWDKNYTIQALLGAARFDDLKINDTSGNGDPAEIDLATIPQLGAAWGTLPKGNRFQYGLETSLLIGFRFDDINYISAGGSGLHVSISTSMWMFDLAGGPYASLFLDKNHRLRLYVAGGPLMVYADYNSERDESSGGTEETFDNSESAFGIGAYARTGFEFRIYEQGMLGLGVRGAWSDIDLSDVGGESELSSYAAFVSFTAGL